MVECSLCEHASHLGEQCEAITGYDHINGDHTCGCRGPMRVIDVIAHLVDTIQQYPEYADSVLRITNEFGEEYIPVTSDTSGDVWLVIQEEHDRTGLCACGARCDHEEKEDLLENGRRLASERENLIAQGVDPADLLIPIAPIDPKKEG